VKSEEASALVSGLAKELYSRMFDWLVDKINVCLSKVGRRESGGKNEGYIGYGTWIYVKCSGVMCIFVLSY
jgi:myosin heavy subunit